MFSVSEDVIREEYDDLSDLDNEQMERVKEWEQQLSGRCRLNFPDEHFGQACTQTVLCTLYYSHETQLKV